jgi:hypothetical protein
MWGAFALIHKTFKAGAELYLEGTTLIWSFFFLFYFFIFLFFFSPSGRH